MKRLNSKGYTFAEVLVASSIIGLAMGAAVSLAATMNFQVVTSRLTSVGTNYAENAARLLQLGQSPASIQLLLPTPTTPTTTTTINADLDSAIVAPSTIAQVSVTTGTTALTSTMGTMDTANVTVTLRNPSGGTHRAYTVQLFTPQLK